MESQINKEYEKPLEKVDNITCLLINFSHRVKDINIVLTLIKATQKCEIAIQKYRGKNAENKYFMMEKVKLVRHFVKHWKKQSLKTWSQDPHKQLKWRTLQ